MKMDVFVGYGSTHWGNENYIQNCDQKTSKEETYE
jgi:hypothetical protein